MDPAPTPAAHSASISPAGSPAGPPAVAAPVAAPVAPPGRVPLDPSLKAAIARARQSDHAALPALLEQARCLRPDLEWPVLELIGLLRDSGRTDDAIATASAMLRDHPQHGPAWVQLGLLHRAGGDHDQALSAFHTAHDVQPADPDPPLQLAHEYAALGEEARAEAFLEVALRLETSNTHALQLAAQRAMATDRPAEALDLFEQARARCPWQTAPYVGACNALVRLGRTTQAMQQLDDAMAQCGSRPVLHARRAQLLRELGFYRDALAAIESGLAEHPQAFMLWEHGGRLLVTAFDPSLALSWLARAVPHRAEDHAVLAGLHGDLAAAAGDHRTAMELHAQAAAGQPGASRHLNNLAIAALNLFDVPAAHTHLQAHFALIAQTMRLKGRSEDPAQTYLGQILNEYRLDARAVAAVAALPESAAARIDALRPLCRACPDSTLLATAMVDAMWRDGLFAMPVRDTAPSTAISRIPRAIAQYWDSSPPPADVLDIAASWPALNPGFGYRMFDDASARDFLQAHHAPHILRAYHRAASPAMKADLFRLAWLATHGGVYADADDRCTGALDGLLPAGADLVLYREYLGTFGNNFMAAAPGHPVILHALDLAAQAIERGDQDILWLSTGPALLTRAVACLAADRPAWLDRVQVWSRRHTLGHLSIHCLAGYKDTPQHWTRAAFRPDTAAGQTRLS